MAYRWTYKAVYIRETTDGKTKWVRLDGVMAKRSGDRVQLKLTDFDDDTGGWYYAETGADEKRFISRRE